MNARPDYSRRMMIGVAGATVATACLPAFGASRQAPDFVGIDGWLNSGPLSIAGLRGRPVLVNFFARSCINCINAMPHIEGWYARYAGRGFVVVGVHTPEFAVERSRPALQAAVERFGLTYPIAQDNESATWRAWHNNAWPTQYLVDREGRIVHSHAGEGDYAETERLIRGLTG